MANAHAQPNTSPSPRSDASPPAPDSRNRPSAETPAAVHATAPTGMRKITSPNRGVRTTNRPVMKPAFEALVCSRPSVWKT